MIKRLLALLTVLCVFCALIIYAEPIQTKSIKTNISKQLKTLGNKIVLADDETTEVRLTGLNIPSLEWGKGENIRESLILALDTWNSNVIRLPVTAARWMGNTDNYRNTVDMVVKAASLRGKYVIIDLHEYVTPVASHITFWESVCDIYANNPAVLFGTLNEPHSTGWEIWRNGGTYSSYESVGHQKIVETIRDKGAKNVLVVGGLDYAFNISGIAGAQSGDTKVYALDDQGSNNDISKAGNGIIYDTHIYTWKKDWEAKVDPVRKLYPVLCGEFGWDAVEDNHKKYGTSETSDVWMNRLFAWMDKDTDNLSKVNFTGWCFHPTASPRMFKNWRYEKTEFSGQHIYDKMMMLPKSGKILGDYVNDFTTDSFLDYSTKPVTGSAQISKSVSGSKLNITYNKPTAGDKAALIMNLTPDWYLKELNQLKVKLQGSTGTVLRIGFQEADTEIWTKDITLTSSSLTEYSVLISELLKKENYRGDGIYDNSVVNVYLEVLSIGSGTVSIDEFSFLSIENGGGVFPQASPYIEREGLYYEYDLDNKSLTKGENNKGAKSDDRFNANIVDNIGYKDSKGVEIFFNRVEGSAYSGYYTLDLPKTDDLTDARYFSFLVKGDGQAFSLRMELVTDFGHNGSILLNFRNDEWYQYTFNIEEELGVFDSERIKGIKFQSAPIGSGTLYADSFTFSSEIPQLLDYEQKTYRNSFSPDTYLDWKTGIGNRWNDTLVLSDVEAIEGTEEGEEAAVTVGKRLSFNTEGLWAGYATAKFSPAWDFSNITHLRVIAKSEAGQSNDLTIILKNSSGPVFRRDITVTDTEEEFIIPLENATDIESIFLTTVKPEQVGDIIISEINFTNY